MVAGYLTYEPRAPHQTPGYIGVAVYPGSYASQLAEYDISTASTYFSFAAAASADKPRPTLPADAGSLTLSVGTALNLAGTVRTSAAADGLAASISISANDLVVGSASASQPADAVDSRAASSPPGNAGSLILGGTKSTLSDGTTAALDVVANSVTVQSGSTLTADEVLLAANQSIDVQSGAVVQTTSAVTVTPPSKAPPSLSIALVNCAVNTCPAVINTGVSATPPTGPTPGLLALSDSNWLIPSNLSSGSYTGMATVALDSGATIATRGALSIDGVGGVTLKGTTSGSGAEWSLGSSSIAITPNGTPSADTLVVGSGLLAQLATARAVNLASAGALDLLEPVTFGVDSSGHPTLNALTLTALQSQQSRGRERRLERDRRPDPDTAGLRRGGGSGAGRTGGGTADGDRGSIEPRRQHAHRQRLWHDPPQRRRSDLGSGIGQSRRRR